MIFVSIIVATLLAGIGSVWLASFLSFGVLARYAQHMLSLAAGALLATAFMHLLPEAFESGDPPHELFAVFLVGVFFFFLLDKAELWHHSHEHSQHAHHHSGGGWAVLFGDGLHAFSDGVLISSAFLADMHLGILAAFAVLAHEVPHHMGDIVVLRQTSGNSQRKALIKVSLAGAMTALGGAVGYFVVDHLLDWLPFFLVAASSSFVYVALADLIPQLQQRLSARQTLAQVAWLALGIIVVTLAVGATHSH